jgi:hypothetical protein
MAVPALIGAGVGAATSLATGRDPMKGALMGGFTGGFFGGPDSLFYNDISGMFGGLADDFATATASGGINSGISDLATRDVLGQSLGMADDLIQPSIGVKIGTDPISGNLIGDPMSNLFTPGVGDVMKEVPYQSIRGVAPDMSYIPGQLGTDMSGVQIGADVLNQPVDPRQLDNIMFPTPPDEYQKSGFEKLKDIGQSAVDYAKDNPFKTGIGAVGLLSVLDPSQTTMPTQVGGGSIKAGNPQAVAYNEMLRTNVSKPNRQLFKLG